MADETVLAETPAAEPVDVTTKIENPAAEVALTETPAETERPAETAPEGDTGEHDETEKQKPGRGFRRLKDRLRLIESDYLTAQSELEQLRREKSEREASNNNPQGRAGVDRAPTEADFPNDWFAFQEAKTAWSARQAVREEFNRAREDANKSGSERARIERRSELLEAYQESATEVRERIPDFDKVVAAAANIRVNPDVADEVLSSEKSALLQYHLAKNPDKVRELNTLSGRELAKEIGRLEARVHLPQPKKATEATPPPTEVRGGSATAIDPQTGPDDMNAYVKWREKQKAS